MSTASRPAPIFTAVVTPESLEPRVAANGSDYTRVRGTVTFRSGRAVHRSLLAFDQSHELVSRLLSPGSPVELALQFRGPSLRVIGLPREASADVTPQAGVLSRTAIDVATDDIASFLFVLEIDGDERSSIIRQLLTGENDRPADEAALDLLDDPDAHIRAPFLDIGFSWDYTQAIVTAIRTQPFARLLDELKVEREQNAARGLLAA